MVWIEIASVVLAIGYVLLIARMIRLGWVFGAASSVLAVWLFWKSNLNSEALLYVFYVLAGVYGYLQWGKQSDDHKMRFKYREWRVLYHIILVFATIAIAIGLGSLMQEWGSDYPYFDAATTSFSFLATFLAARKILSNWLYWIIIDLASAYLYYLKDLYYYSTLMIVYTVLAAYGYYQWRKAGHPL